MIRVVHLFSLKKDVQEAAFIEWLDARLDVVTREFGCLERKTWIFLDGFTGDYLDPRPVKGRPKYVNEAYWRDAASANRFREWLTGTPEGRELHDRWFGAIENHTVLRYVDGWAPVTSEE
jgi:hypothetical protein